MKPIAACVLAALLVVVTNASAEWVKQDIKDEMRGTTKTAYLVEADPVSGQGPTVSLRVIEEADGKIGVIFSAEKNTKFASCGDSLCDIEFRFDDSAVQKRLFVSKGGAYRLPVDVASFAGALQLSTHLYIEFYYDLENKYQYMFDIAELPVSVSRVPSIVISGFELGKKYSEDEISLKKYRGGEGESCYSGGDQDRPFGAQKVSKISLCFSSGYFRTALIDPGSKAAYAEGVSFLSKSFGSMDKDSIMPAWPRDDGKLLRMNTKSASYFSSSKKDYTSTFIISDGVADLLAR